MERPVVITSALFGCADPHVKYQLAKKTIWNPSLAYFLHYVILDKYEYFFIVHEF
jgi:hypothetical protein